MTVRINKQKINLREKLAEAEEKVNFEGVVRGLGEYNGNVGIGIEDPVNALHVHGQSDGLGYIRITDGSTGSTATDGARIGYNALGLRIQNYENTNISFFTNNSTQALTIKNDGNVGIGTTNPGAKLEVYQDLDTSGGASILKVTNTRLNTGSSSSVISLITDEVDGNTADTRVQLAGSYDGTNGGKLDILTNDGTSLSPAVTIKHDGNVGIGTTSPSNTLDIYKQTNTTSDNVFTLRSNVGGVAAQIKFKVTADGSAYTGSTPLTSDDRLKHNEQKISEAIQTLGKITPRKYIKTSNLYEADHDFEIDEDGNPVDENGEVVEHRIEAGVIAQEVMGIPELAFTVRDEELDEDGNTVWPYSLDYNSLFTYAIAAIQEQQSIIEDLKSRIETLESK